MIFCVWFSCRGNRFDMYCGFMDYCPTLFIPDCSWDVGVWECIDGELQTLQTGMKRYMDVSECCFRYSMYHFMYFMMHDGIYLSILLLAFLVQHDKDTLSMQVGWWSATLCRLQEALNANNSDSNWWGRRKLEYPTPLQDHISCYCMYLIFYCTPSRLQSLVMLKMWWPFLVFRDEVVLSTGNMVLYIVLNFVCFCKYDTCKLAHFYFAVVMLLFAVLTLFGIE